MAVKVQEVQRWRADILEFRSVGRHEGAKALISERTPRQTERERAEREERRGEKDRPEEERRGKGREAKKAKKGKRERERRKT